MNILCPSVYNFLTGMLPSDIIVSIDEIEDKQTRRVLEQVRNALYVYVYDTKHTWDKNWFA